MSTMLLDQFDTLVDSSEAVEGLRRLVLDLAVRGRLVPQDPDDEPASELLGRIAIEKAHLFKAGEIRKPKQYPSLTETEQPYDLPSGWSWTRLGAVRHGCGQVTPDAPFSYIDVSSIDKERGVIGSHIDVVQPDDAPSRARKQVRAGTVLYSTVRPNLLNVAIVDRAFDPPPIASTAFAIVHPFSGVDSRYLYYYLRSQPMIDFVESKMVGLAYPAISDAKLYQAPFPLAPEVEQRRIVARVDELMVLCDRLAKGIAQRNAQREQWAASTVRHLSSGDSINGTPAWPFAEVHFPSLVSTPEDIPRLRELVLDLAVRGKLTQRDPDDEPASALLRRIEAEKKRLYKAGEIRKPKALPSVGEEEQPFDPPDGWTWARFDSTCINRDAERVPLSRAEREKRQGPYDYYGASGVIDSIDDFLFEKPLLLIGEDGANLLLRSKPIAFIADGRYWVNNHAHVVDAVNSVTLEYLAIAIEATDLSPWVTGTAQPKLNQSRLNSIPVPFPPLAEQRRVVERVDLLMSLCDELEAELAAAERDGDRLMRAVLEEALAA